MVFCIPAIRLKVSPYFSPYGGIKWWLLVVEYGIKMFGIPQNMVNNGWLFLIIVNLKASSNPSCSARTEGTSERMCLSFSLFWRSEYDMIWRIDDREAYVYIVSFVSRREFNRSFVARHYENPFHLDGVLHMENHGKELVNKYVKTIHNYSDFV